MSRGCVQVRAAVGSDLPVVVDLAYELQESNGPVRDQASARLALQARYAEVLTDPDRRLVLAVDAGGAVLGMGMLQRISASLLADVPAVLLSHTVVAGGQRRRGAGRALVAAATSYAEESGVAKVVVTVHPGSREANRFYARLGFAPLATRRVAAVPVLRRRLAQSQPRAMEPLRRAGLRPGRRGPRSGALLGPVSELAPVSEPAPPLDAHHSPPLDSAHD